MKQIRTLKFHGLALAALLLGSATLAVAQTQNTNVQTFDASYPDWGANNTAGLAPWSCGTLWGPALMAWDDTQDSNANAGGSAYIAVNYVQNQDTPFIAQYCWPWENWYYYNAANGAVDLSLYTNVHFNVKWDTANSQIGIDQFNYLTNWPLQYLVNWTGNGGWNTDSNYLAGSGFYAGFNLYSLTGSGGTMTLIGTAIIPDAASNGWVDVTVPINPSTPNLNPSVGIVLAKWYNNNWDVVGGPASYMWIDNIWYEGTAAPPPPPTITSLTLPTPGLNQVFNTGGQFDRHEVTLVSSNGLSWVGNATVGNPVTYSFTVNGYPKNVPALSTAVYLMMSPNPAYLDNALDWNETNCVVLWLQQQGDTTAQMQFLYKTNLVGAATSTLLGTVTNTGSALGTWSVTFTSDTAGTLTAPDNSQTSFTFPPDAAAIFAENPSVGQPGFYLYLGCQPNTAAAQNQAVCYSRFSVSGVPSAQTNDFLADQVLNTNMWRNGPGSGSPIGNFVNPTNAAYWIRWTTPASGYSLQSATDLSGTWTTLTSGSILSGSGAVQQLITTNDVPVDTSASFFRLMKP